jgi:hypothetical protein
MATLTGQVSTYQVIFVRQLEIGGGKYSAAIVCTGTDGTRMYLCFARPDSVTLSNSYNPQYRNGNVFLPYELYPTCIDLLRNEKPVSMYFNSDRPEWNQLLTGNEPVGDGE